MTDNRPELDVRFRTNISTEYDRIKRKAVALGSISSVKRKLEKEVKKSIILENLLENVDNVPDIILPHLLESQRRETQNKTDSTEESNEARTLYARRQISESLDKIRVDLDVITEEDEKPEEKVENSEEFSTETLSVPQQNERPQTPQFFSEKLPKILAELVENEQNYVKNLGAGIKNYLTFFEDPEFEPPESLKDKTYDIFCNIKEIHLFHQDVLMPRLKNVEEDAQKIAEIFSDLIEEQSFYCYVIYAINKKHSDELCLEHREFFKEFEERTEDKLGIFSFLLQPVQRIPRYQLLLREMIKQILPYGDEKYELLAKVCEAEKNVVRLLNTINDSVSVHDLKLCYQESQCQKSHIGSRSNITTFGNFYKATRFTKITDKINRKCYKGKIFLFEKFIIYTKERNNGTLEYMGRFECNDVEIAYFQQNKKLKIHERSNISNAIDLISTEEIILEWSSLLENIVVKNFENEICEEGSIVGNIENLEIFKDTLNTLIAKKK